VRSLVEKSNIGKRDTVVEIGPGKGIITEQLANRCNRVIGIEYDHSLIAGLKNKFENFDNIEIVEGDFLKWDLPNYPYKVFSNIPFNMTADIVTKLLGSKNSPESTYLIMQDKAAERFIGEPVSNNSQTSISLKPFYDMDIVQRINREQFTPIPKVNTVLTEFIKKECPEISNSNYQEYRDFVTYGFNQWKPTIVEAFKNIFSYKQTKIIKENLNLANLKPTELTIKQWIELFKIYMTYVPDAKKKEVKGYESYFNSKHKGIKKEHRTRNS
jgi:23S rRNA (adenine-N6)-dimethyltransferase